MGCLQSSGRKYDVGSSGEAEAGAGKAKDVQQLDQRLPFANYREFFQVKNYWKTVSRQSGQASKLLLLRFLKANPEFHQLYPKLRGLNLAEEERLMDNPDFESTAAAYLQVFDDVVTDVEANPGSVDGAVTRLTGVGRIHKRHAGLNSGSFQAIEEPFLRMLEEVLQDRFNDKCQTLFKKFFQFCLTYIVQGYNEA